MESLQKTILLVLFYIFTILLTPALGAAEDVTIGDFQNLWSGSFVKTEVTGESPHYKVISKASEGPSYIAASPVNGVSLTNRYIRVKIRVNDLNAWGGIELRISSDKKHDFKNYYAIAIPFYSDPEFNILQNGHWAELTFSLGQAKIIGKPKKDSIQHIGFYVANKEGSPESFQVDFKDFAIEKSMTKAIVSMTFDDGYDDHFEAAKIMHKYGLRGTAYIMTNEIGMDSYLTKEQMMIMQEEYKWSMSSHHKIPITNFSTAELKKEMDSTFDFLEDLNMSLTAPHFAYPLGKQDRAKTLPYIREVFKTARVAGGGAETLPPSDWHMLRTYNVTPDKTPQQIAERVQRAIDNNEWLILMFHFFTPETPKDDLTYNYQDFETLCSEIEKSGVRVHPVDEVYEAFQ